jgi:hypothetical protein
VVSSFNVVLAYFFLFFFLFQSNSFSRAAMMEFEINVGNASWEAKQGKYSERCADIAPRGIHSFYSFKFIMI